MSAKKKLQMQAPKDARQVLDEIRIQLENGTYHNPKDFEQAVGLWTSVLELYGAAEDFEARWISANEQFIMAQYHRAEAERATKEAQDDAIEWGKRAMREMLSEHLDLQPEQLGRVLGYFDFSQLADLSPYYLKKLREAIVEMDAAIVDATSPYTGDDED